VTATAVNANTAPEVTLFLEALFTGPRVADMKRRGQA